MNQYKCDVCGRAATNHETVIENGGAIVSRHYCQEHGVNVLLDTLGVDDPAPQAAFATLIEWYDGLSDSEKSRLQLEYRLTSRCS